MKHLKEAFSILENRLSIMVIVFIISSIVGLLQCIITGDMSPNLLEFLFYLITAITGVNIVRGASSLVGKNKTINSDIYGTYNDDVKIVEEANESPDEEFKI